MIQTLKQFYVSLTNALVAWCPPDNFISDADMNSVLLIRLDELGDFILWLDSAKEYRNIYPEKKITLLVNEKWYDLAKKLTYWDDVIGMDTLKFRFNPFYRLKYLLFIRRNGFQIAICPRHTIQFLLEPAIVAISGAEEKIVFRGNFPVEKKNYWTRMVQGSAETKHELNRNAEFIRGLGNSEFRSSIPRLPFIGYPGNDRIIICPSSFRKEKEWPIENYIELIKRISGHKIFVLSDKRYEFNNPIYVHDITGGTSVLELISFIEGAKLVIANDSAPIHIAAALNVPSVCIGAGKWGKRFVPYDYESSRDGSVPPKVIYNQKVKEITIDEVWKLVKEMI